MDSRRCGSWTALALAVSCMTLQAGHEKRTFQDEVPSAPAISTPVPSVQTLPYENEPPKMPPHARKLNCVLTAYTAGFESTGKNPGDPGYGVTASGKVAYEGRTIAVDPTLIPIGSHVYIEGLGERLAEDTGGAIKGAHIDVFFNNRETAVKFGVKKDVPVYIIES